MKDIVQNVKAEISIVFSDGRIYNIPMSDGITSLNNYCSSIDIDEQLYQSSSDNIIGNICGNTLSLELISKDGLLIPNNKSSSYYGFMNDTAYIEIYFNVIDTETKIYMGRYYVDTWEGGADSSKSNEVSISAVDLFSKIKNIPLGKIRVKRNLSFIDYIKTIINNVNKTLPENMKVLYDDDDLDIYRNSQYTWQMEYNNFDRDTLESLFNNIAKDSISYIWIDRDRHLKTDHLLDDSAEESVSELSGSSNLLSYNVQTGDIDKYSGVSVKFINSISHAYDELLTINGVELYSNEDGNDFSDRQLSQSTVEDISLIQVVCDGDESKQGECIDFDWYKDTINLTIICSEQCVANISVWGTYIIEDYDTVVKYKDANTQDSLIEVENRTLRKELINTYVDGLLNLMSMKNNMVSCQGFLNPEIRLADTVNFIGSRFKIDDYYKVTGLKYSLSSGSYRCDASLIKVIKTEDNLDDILYRYNEALMKRISGVYIDTFNYGFNTLSSTQIDICEEQIGWLIDQLVEMGV